MADGRCGHCRGRVGRWCRCGCRCRCSGRRRCGRGSWRGGRGALLEAGDALGQRRDRRVGVGAGEADQGDLERDAGVEGVLDPDEGVAQQLEGPGGAGGGEAAGLVGDPGLVGLRQPGEVGVDRGEEDVAQAGDQRLAEHPGVAAPAHGDLDGHEGAAGVVVAQRLEQLVDGVGGVGGAAGGDHPVEGGERVAGRAASGAQDVGAALGRELEPGVGDHEVDQALEVDRREEVDLEVLGAAADGGQHLLRVGGGQHEHDVVGRLLERLQQRVRRRRREHVDLVEDVHLRAPGRAERGLGDEVADGLHAVVRGRVELVDVEAGAALDREARGALAARLAVDRVLAVEDLGEDAGGGGLAGAAGPGEQVGVADPVLDDGVAQGVDQVLLAPDLAEATGPITTVERLVGHRRRAYRPPTTPAAAPSHPRGSFGHVGGVLSRATGPWPPTPRGSFGHVGACWIEPPGSDCRTPLVDFRTMADHERMRTTGGRTARGRRPRRQLTEVGMTAERGRSCRARPSSRVALSSGAARRRVGGDAAPARDGRGARRIGRRCGVDLGGGALGRPGLAAGAGARPHQPSTAPGQPAPRDRPQHPPPRSVARDRRRPHPRHDTGPDTARPVAAAACPTSSRTCATTCCVDGSCRCRRSTPSSPICPNPVGRPAGPSCAASPPPGPRATNRPGRSWSAGSRRSWKRAGEPPFERQVDLGDDEGWIGRVDFADRRLKVVVEVQSETFHSSLSDRRRDAERFRRLRAAGWIVVEVTEDEIFHRPRARARAGAIGPGVRLEPRPPEPSTGAGTDRARLERRARS